MILKGRILFTIRLFLYFRTHRINYNKVIINCRNNMTNMIDYCLWGIKIGDEVLINMRIGYVLLILSILLVCLWFTYVSVQSKEYYRRAFRMLMWAGVIMYVNHLYGISMEEGLLTYNQGMIIAERIIHYILCCAF